MGAASFRPNATKAIGPNSVPTIKAGMSEASVSQGLHNAIRNLRDGSQGGNCTTREARDARLIEVEESQESRIGDPIVWAAYIHIGI
jgi:hypothetical protein